MTSDHDWLIEEFTGRLRANEDPRIEDYLRQVAPDAKAGLLRRLLTIEIASSAGVEADHYFRRFPQYCRLIDAVFRSLEPTEQAGPPDETPVVGGIFALLSHKVLAANSAAESFSAGEVVIRHGEHSDDLFLIEEGEVEARLPHEGGAVILGRSGPGETVGEMALLATEPRTANVFAVTDVRARRMSATAFHELAGTYPPLARFLTDLVARRLGGGTRDALSGKVLNGYRILRKLGRGSTGIVYEACEETSGHQVALKMMSHDQVYSAGSRERFRREAELAAELAHPNIIALSGSFEAFHTCFLVLEYCDGRTLAEAIADDGAMAETSLRRLLSGLAGGLAYAHDRGVIHRDIKPANIMVTASGDAKLMDFGLASTRATIEGGISGTVRYMAPEQRVGLSVGPEADYFALGCVVYEVLTGDPLFGDGFRTELNRSFEQWQPPDLTSLRPDVPAEVLELVQPALRVDPEKRQLDLKTLAAW